MNRDGAKVFSDWLRSQFSRDPKGSV
jgi:hypothetical protein